MRGIGFQPAGTSPAGVGAPDQTEMPSNVVLPDQLDLTVGHGGRRIDPKTRDYVMTEDGRLEGMSDVQQLVYIAVANAGPQLQEIEKLDGMFETAVESVLTAAVAHITALGLIEIIGVSTRKNDEGGLEPGQAVTLFRWKDLTTNEEQGTPV